MAGRGSTRGAYWFGALVGLSVSGGVAAWLSLTTPLSEAAPPVGDVAEADADASEAGGEPAQVAAADETAAQNDAAEAPAPVDEAADAQGAGARAEAAPAPDEVESQTAETPVADAAEPAVGEAVAPEAGNAAETAPATEAATAIAPEAATVAAAVAGAPAPRYLDSNSSRYDGDLSKPVLSIVLTGAGEGREADMEGILQLDKRVAIVVAPGAPDKAALASRLKDAGVEVLAGWRAEGGSLAESGPVIGAAVLNATTADEALQINKTLLANGAALVDLSQPEGGAPYRLAVWMDLPSASAVSRIDEIDDSELVYQALERAAEKATGAGVVVVVGEASPAVLSGVRRWMSVKAGVAVDVAPVSAAIRKLSE